MSDHTGQYDHEHAQSNHAERTQTIYTTVTDVLDTVASFDGRFSFTPVDPGGHGVLSFAARDEQLDLVVHVTHDAAADHVRVTLSQRYPAGDAAGKANAATEPTLAQGSAPGEVLTTPAQGSGTNTAAAPASPTMVAYEGSRSATAIHYQLGAALAKWYGEVVRSQFGPTLGEDEG